MSNHNLVFIGTGLSEIDEFGRILSDHRYPSTHGQLVRQLETARKFPPHSSAFYRTEVVKSIGGYRRRFRCSQDRDLWLRLSEVGELACLEEPLVLIRKHVCQISHGESGKRQHIDARVAVTSYWLRKKLQSDPLESDAETFKFFYAWFKRELEDDLSFGVQEYKRRLKMVGARADKRSTFSYGFYLVLSFLKEPLMLFRFIRERLIGDPIGRRLADKWVKTQQLSTRNTR